MATAAPKPKILVVDDDPGNRALSLAILEDAGYVVVLADGGEQALKLFEAEHPDCVLLDVRMPRMDGFAVCARLRTSPQGAQVPIIFLTAQRDIETFDQTLHAGGDDFLTKPVRPAELVVRVQMVLKLKRVGEALAEPYMLVRDQRIDQMRLQLQNEQLTTFVIHDLKNPVNTMDLQAQSLLRDAQLSPRARESVQCIRREAQALLRLVTNLLDISKSDEGRLVPRRAAIDLEALLRELYEEHAINARSAGVSLGLEIEAGTTFADADLIRRVIANLLENAVRHAPEASAVMLRAQALPGATEIRIADRGPGVPAAMRDKLFERYFQLEDREHPVNRMGRGLGLTFCKLAVEAHGGKIWIEDGNPGSVFCVRLPDEGAR